MDLFEEKNERLIITHITNENFKSFAGVQKLGPFHKSFTSIVGPNGSGKSNVIDSILFVFGYRSSKIRSKKLSNLIHKSENYPNCKQCTVSIHFAKIDEANNDKVIDNFAISRTARIDNTSDYYIDHDTKISFTEIQKLLLSYDIDVEHNRFLILQGEVEQISLMKPKAMNEHDDGILEYLEDIIGTNKFIEPINKIKQSMESLNDLRAEKYNRVKVTEKEKANMEPFRQKALEFMEKEKQRNRLKAIILLNKINQIELEDGHLTSKKKSLEEQLKQMIISKEKSENELANLTENIDNITNELSPLTKKVDQLKRKLVQMEKDQTKNLQEEKYLKTKIDELETEIKDTITKQTEISSSFEKINSNLDNLCISKEKLQVELKEYEESYNTLMIDVKKSTKDLTKEKAELDEIILRKTEEINKIKMEIDDVKSQCEALRSNEKNVITQIKQCENHIKEIEYFLKENENNNKLKEIESEKQDLMDLQQKLDAIKNEEMSLVNMHKEKHTSYEHAKAQRSNSKFKNRIVESLLKAQSKGEIKGIYGRMGDLAYIPPEYDCAVSTAFPSLDNILVENIDVAKQGVEFLRQNNLGTSTFICLDKMKTWRSRVEETKNNFKTPNNVPRLFDLIELTDLKFETAFYFIMRDTLVSKNMEEATAIAFQGKHRWRVVTLAGELVEKSGTMSGGGSRKTTGRMLTTSNKGNICGGGRNLRRMSDLDVHKLEIDINNLKNQISDIKSKKSKMTSTIDSLSKSIPIKETNLQKIYMEIDASKNELVEINNQLNKLNHELENVKPDQKELDRLKSVISQKNQVFEKANSALDKIKTKAESVNEQITTISNKILQQIQFKINSVSRLIEQVSSEISKNNAVISNNKKQDDKLQKTLIELNKEFSKYEKKLNIIVCNNMKNNTNGVVCFEKQHSQMKEELDENETKLEKYKKDLSELQSTTTRLQTEIENQKMMLVDTRNDLDKISSRCASSSHTIASIRKELDTLDVPNEEIGDWKKKSHEVDKLRDSLTELELFLKENTVNLQIIDDYKEKVSAYMERVAELEEITQQRDKYRLELDGLHKNRLNTFMEGFSIINSKLKEFYRLITLGGDAELEFVDSLDPFIEGVVFSVRPPNKSWKVIGNLSGGEKTLSSLALVFALHYFRPSPFYVMDEIDAALDFKNVSIIANYIKERTKNAQFIIISLRNNMFELASVLVGIYKTDNCTKSIAVDPFKMITIE